MNVDDLRRHIAFKRDGERSLKPQIAAHMLDALDNGATADYQTLLRSANWPEPPKVVYHTANPADRVAILTDGLCASQPGTGGSAWPDPDGVWAAQPSGVYVAELADTAGRWSRWANWDVWQVNVTGLGWEPDTMNPRCWLITADINPARLRLTDPRAVEHP